jgi:hypothetical protein
VPDEEQRRAHAGELRDVRTASGGADVAPWIAYGETPT